MPLVSIIIPLYNAAGTVGQAIDSLLQQSYREVEIIVVDDGSTDSSGATCMRYGDRICYFVQENRGSSAARNRGIREAKGQYIGFLDADDIYLPDKICWLVELFNTYPEVGAVSGAFIEKHKGWEKINPHPGMTFRDGCEHGLIDYFMAEYRGCWVVHTNTILIKREVLDTVGLFNEKLKFGEDVDLWCRIAGRYPMAFLDKPVACYDRANEQSLCFSHAVLEQGVGHLYGRREEQRYIDPTRRKSYRLFKNKIIYARLMLSIYEKNRRMLWTCLKKLYPLSFNVRVIIALVVLPLPVVFWPKKNIFNRVE